MNARENQLAQYASTLHLNVTQIDKSLRMILADMQSKEECLSVLNDTLKLIKHDIELAESAYKTAIYTHQTAKDADSRKSNQSTQKALVKALESMNLAKAGLNIATVDAENAVKRLYAALKQSIKRDKPVILGSNETIGLVKKEFVIRVEATKPATTEVKTEVKKTETVDNGESSQVTKAQYDALSLRLDKAVKQAQIDAKHAKKMTEISRQFKDKLAVKEKALASTESRLTEAKAQNEALRTKLAEFEAIMKVAKAA